MKTPTPAAPTANPDTRDTPPEHQAGLFPENSARHTPTAIADVKKPAKIKTARPSIWIVRDRENVICNHYGWFGSQADCEADIARTARPGPDGQPRYSALEVQGRHDNEFWIITDAAGAPKSEHGFFTSREAASEHIERKLEPETCKTGRRPRNHRAWPIQNSKLR